MTSVDMSRSMPDSDLARLCAPRSVAVVGASEDDRKFGGRLLKYLVKHGFSGDIVPINPKATGVLGIPAYPSVAAAGRPIDVAIMALPAEHIEASIADCAAAGVRFAVIITASFAEAGVEGLERQRRILDIARSAGMRILGPNCLGLMSPHARLALTPSLSMERSDLPRGGVALVSQSGALMGTMFDYGADRGIGFSLGASVGNQVDIEICDFLDFAIDDPNTRVIATYVEGLANPLRFLDCARRAHAAGKVLLVTKAGRSEAGVAAARSHTASLAGSYTAFSAACRSAGVMLFDDPNSMVEVAGFLCEAPSYREGGAAVFSGSGGGCAVALDRISEIGFPIAELSEATKASLDGVLQESHRHLPLDLGVLQGGWSRANIAAALERTLRDPHVGAGVCVLTTQPLMVETVEEAVKAGREAGKPVIIVNLAGSAGDASRAACRRLGYACFDTMDGALRALAAISFVSGAKPSVPGAVEPTAVPSALDGRIGRLTEHEAKLLAASAGIRVTREIVAVTAAQATAAAEEIGFPVVLKGVSKALVHKSDVGAVKLNLKDAAAVDRAFADIAQAFSTHGIAGFEGCVVQEMGHGEVELFLGAKHDPEFGALILIGIGGTTVELLGDVQVALAPVSEHEALAMMKRMKLWPLMDGFRGRPAVDVTAAARAASRLSELAAGLGPRLQEIDINPLLVGARGAGVIAVDGRATMVAGT